MADVQPPAHCCRSSRLANNRWDFRSRLHNTWCFVRKKLWVAALAMFYLYNEAAVSHCFWLRGQLHACTGCIAVGVVALF